MMGSGGSLPGATSSCGSQRPVWPHGEWAAPQQPSCVDRDVGVLSSEHLPRPSHLPGVDLAQCDCEHWAGDLGAPVHQKSAPCWETAWGPNVPSAKQGA